MSLFKAEDAISCYIPAFLHDLHAAQEAMQAATTQDAR